MILYKCVCGCVNDRPGLISTTWQGRKIMRCRKHPTVEGGRVSYRFIICADCGKEVIVNPNSSTTVRCEDCRTEKRKENRRRQAQRYRDRQKANPEPGIEEIDPKIENGLTKENLFDCTRFEEWCGECIRPHFPCRMYKRQAVFQKAG